MTMTDTWGNPLTTTAEAAGHWRDFTHRNLTLRSGDGTALHSVVEADPGFALGRAMGALASLVDGDASFDADTEIAAARAGRADHDWERSFVDAAAALVDGGLWGAGFERWRTHHDRFPSDLVGLSMAAFLIIFSARPDRQGQVEARLRRSQAAVGEDVVLLGSSAMMAQERGDLDECHRLAARALELDPTGFSGAHPLAHVYFESGEHAAGRDWLDDWLPTADQEAQFLGHLVWHSALHHLAEGDTATTLERYRRCGGSVAGGRLIDGPSLLWRCQLHGLVPRATDPEDPTVHALAAPMMDGVPFTFLGAHVVLALATGGDAEGLHRFAHNAASFDAPGAAELLPRLATAFAAYVEGDHDRAARGLLGLESEWNRVGGSHAQREVFEDTLIQALALAGHTEEAAERLKARLDRRPSTLDSRLLVGLG